MQVLMQFSFRGWGKELVRPAVNCKQEPSFDIFDLDLQ